MSKIILDEEVVSEGLRVSLLWVTGFMGQPDY